MGAYQYMALGFLQVVSLQKNFYKIYLSRKCIENVIIALFTTNDVNFTYHLP